MFSASAAYWKSGASGSQSHDESQDITAAHPPLPRSKSKPPSKASRAAAPASAHGRKARTIAEDEDESIDLAISEVQDDDMMDEDEEPLIAPKTTRSKAGAKAPKSPTKSKKPASKASPKSKTTAKAKAKAKPSTRKGKQPALFLSDPSDDEDDDAGVVDLVGDSDGGDSALVSELIGDDREAAMTSTLRSTAGTQVRRAAARAVKKRPVALVDFDGDSDDDAVFKGFGGRKRGRIG